jgi:hypothetical protein
MNKFVVLRVALLLGSLFILSCGADCTLSDGKCGSGCHEVLGNPVIDGSSGPCTDDPEVLTCSADDETFNVPECVAAPDGDQLYLTDETGAGLLIDEGYTRCTDEQQQTLEGISRCK